MNGEEGLVDEWRRKDWWMKGEEGLADEGINPTSVRGRRTEAPSS